jgi:hypothetical protein
MTATGRLAQVEFRKDLLVGVSVSFLLDPTRRSYLRLDALCWTLCCEIGLPSGQYVCQKYIESNRKESGPRNRVLTTTDSALAQNLARRLEKPRTRYRDKS